MPLPRQTPPSPDPAGSGTESNLTRHPWRILKLAHSHGISGLELLNPPERLYSIGPMKIESALVSEIGRGTFAVLALFLDEPLDPEKFAHARNLITLAPRMLATLQQIVDCCRRNFDADVAVLGIGAVVRQFAKEHPDILGNLPDEGGGQ